MLTLIWRLLAITAKEGSLHPETSVDKKEEALCRKRMRPKPHRFRAVSIPSQERTCAWREPIVVSGIVYDAVSLVY